MLIDKIRDITNHAIDNKADEDYDKVVEEITAAAKEGKYFKEFLYSPWEEDRYEWIFKKLSREGFKCQYTLGMYADTSTKFWGVRVSWEVE